MPRSRLAGLSPPVQFGLFHFRFVKIPTIFGICFSVSFVPSSLTGQWHGRIWQMAKKFLAEPEMTDVTVDALRQEHQELIKRRMRCRGDGERAMYSLQEEFGLDYWPQWNFQYKRERKPSQTFLNRLRQVILLVTSKSVQKDIAKLEIEAAKGNVAPDLEGLRAEAQALLAKIEAATVKP